MILDDDTAPYLVLHGLNGVYIKEYKKWIRLDSRGNKLGVEAQFFKQIGRDVYSIVKLRVNGKVFSGDACNCFDGVIDEEENLPKARIYCKNSAENKSPIIETLIDGDIVVEEVIEDYKEYNIYLGQ